MSTPGHDKQRFLFELVDCGEPDATPARIRLRHFLKAALRQWRLRCVGGRILDAELPADDSTTTPTSEESSRTEQP